MPHYHNQRPVEPRVSHLSPSSHSSPAQVSKSLESEPSQITCSAPFDDEDADLIIRSCDDVHFRVFKVILKKASPVFGGMFSLPSTGSKEIPSVDVSEDGETMTQLLRLCYPTCDSRLKTLDQVSRLMDACGKYQMDDAARRVAMTTLGNFMSKDPIHAYALACRAGASREAGRAAFHCLSISPSDIVVYNNNDLCRISVAAYRNLLEYHLRCRQAAASVVAQWDYKTDAERYCWVHSQRSYGYRAPRQEYVCPWWTGTMKVIADELLHKLPPMAPITSNLPLLDVGDISCKECKPRAQVDMYRFATVLEAGIEKALHAVEFTFQW
ncbi:hypothetical protein BDW22DRAFT_1360933 [Trametopsis cervina]|nr:hypothetical protein BDW22DRAFT_1360933 [Trametopsis cervina]